MRADQHVDLAGGELGEDAALLGRACESARPSRTLDRQVLEALAEGQVVLLGEDGRGHQHERLLAALGRLEGGAQGDLGLAVADVAADQAVHRVGRLHVVLDVVDGLGLVVGLLEGEAVLEAARELAVGGEGVAGHGLAGGVRAEQLAGHLGDRLAGPRLDGLPGGAAEAG